MCPMTCPQWDVPPPPRHPSPVNMMDPRGDKGSVGDRHQRGVCVTQCHSTPTSVLPLKDHRGPILVCPPPAVLCHASWQWGAGREPPPPPRWAICRANRWGLWTDGHSQGASGHSSGGRALERGWGGGGHCCAAPSPAGEERYHWHCWAELEAVGTHSPMRGTEGCFTPLSWCHSRAGGGDPMAPQQPRALLLPPPPSRSSSRFYSIELQRARGEQRAANSARLFILTDASQRCPPVPPGPQDGHW